MRDGPKKHSVDRPKSAWALWGESEPRGAFFWWPIGIYVVFLGLWILADRSANRFDRDGILTEAEVVALDQTSSRNSDGEWQTDYIMDYVYEADGRRIEDRASRGAPWGREVGERFEIRYLASNPKHVEVRVGGTRAVAGFLGWLLFALSLLIAGLLIVRGSAVIQALRARRIGEEVTGRIVEMRMGRRKVKGRPVRGRGWIAWMTEDGISGSHGDIPYYVYQRYQKGDRLRLFRLGGRTWWEGDVGPRRLDESRVPVVPQDE